MASRSAYTPLPRTSSSVPYVLGAWVIFALVYGTAWLVAGRLTPDDIGWVYATSFTLAGVWAALTPLVFLLGRIARPSRIGWPMSVLAHSAAAAVAAAIAIRARQASVAAFSDLTPDAFLSAYLYWLDVWLFVYLTIVAVGHALGVRRRYVDRSVRAHLLEAQLARAQLQYLEIQLQPHFLFNSLNAIQELAHESPNAAERMLRRLHALLSISLDRSGQDEVTLDEELAALEPYLDIQRTRFSDWLDVHVDVPAETRNAMVPHLILQPLVENAIRHGLSVRPGFGRIAVSAWLDGERLQLVVQDNGVGLQRSRGSGREGIGLRNASERLRQLYGADYRFELRDAPTGGVVVEIELPYRAGAPTLPSTRDATADDDAPTVEDIQAWRTGEYSSATIASAESAPETSPEPPTPEWQASGTFRAARAVDGVAATAPSRGLARSETPALAVDAYTGTAASPGLTARSWLGLAAIWIGLAIFWTSQMLLFTSSRASDRAAPIVGIAKLQIATSFIWLMLSPIVFWLARRFRIDSTNWRRRVPLHLLGAISVGFIHTGLMQASGISETPVLSVFNLNPLTGDFFVYIGLLAWSHSRDFVAWYRARELETARLTSRIAYSRFLALRVQLRPQFLLSTLDLLADLVHHDVPRAERLITRLADTLRLTLDLGRESMTTIHQELELLSACVEAHRIGIRPGVRLETNVPPTTLGLLLPSRLLCTIADELLAAETMSPNDALVVHVVVERMHDTTRIRLRGDARWAVTSSRTEPHAWWRAKSVAEAAVADAGALVSLTFPDRATAVLIVADDTPVVGETPTPELVAAGA